MDIRVDGLVLLSTVNDKYSTSSSLSSSGTMGCAFLPISFFFFEDRILLSYFFFGTVSS
jgi:hypothetical protein